MTKEAKEAILKYWKRVVMNEPPIIKDWLSKEDLYLKKNIKNDSCVLDIGCGTGRSIKTIKDIAKKIVGIDNNKAVIGKIRKKLSKFNNVVIYCKDAENTSLKDNTFDYTICVGNTFGDFGHDKIKILKEMKRLTKKKGKIIVSVFSEKALPIRLKIYKKAGMTLKKIGEDGTIITAEGINTEQFSQQKLKKIFSMIGLDVKIIKLNPISYICEATKGE